MVEKMIIELLNTCTCNSCAEATEAPLWLRLIFAIGIGLVGLSLLVALIWSNYGNQWVNKIKFRKYRKKIIGKCPLCGNEEIKIKHWSTYGTEDLQISILCKKCGHWGVGYPEDALRKWNQTEEVSECCHCSDSER